MTEMGNFHSVAFYYYICSILPVHLFSHSLTEGFMTCFIRYVILLTMLTILFAVKFRVKDLEPWKLTVTLILAVTLLLAVFFFF